ncbi:hypothetical protein GCM10010987_44690 [Bradyrhizobium guangdongense]|uniref:Uncharacterized protein n=1 Tax=Bradyrhizobium guangdongense TaxID=1325090 RepID=A0AA88B857_9BRAD|nr:hypothetical protein GCM10010987_44690 [Bradyrhizobium guangdongense]
MQERAYQRQCEKNIRSERRGGPCHYDDQSARGRANAAHHVEAEPIQTDRAGNIFL